MVSLIMMSQTKTTEREQRDGLPVYRIPEANIDHLRERIVKMNRRAKRLGMAPLVLSEFGTGVHVWMEDILDSTGRWQKIERSVALILCTVAGSLPRVDGWAMAATIQHEAEGNILRTVPGFETTLPIHFRSCDTACEHCGTNRVRKDTYVLQSEADEWKQVGRNCLADFLRTGDAAGWAEMAEILASLAGEMEGFEGMGEFSCGEHTGFSLLALLAQVACIVRQDGWCSRTEARNAFGGKQATVDAATPFFSAKALQYMDSAKIEKYQRTEPDEQRAADAIAWAQALETAVDNDYLWNLRVVSHREFIGYREVGLAGSMIAAYNRHLEQELKRKYEREQSLDEHFGTPGKRETFTLTVIGTREIEGNYGLTTLIRFRDPAGRIATWFCSGSAPDEMELDATVAVKATVKAHGEYQGMRQTQLTRVALPKGKVVEIAA